MKIKFLFRLADLIHSFYPRTEWNVKIVDCVQDLCSEALFLKCSSSRNAGECAEWDGKD